MSIRSPAYVVSEGLYPTRWGTSKIGSFPADGPPHPRIFTACPFLPLGQASTERIPAEFPAYSQVFHPLLPGEVATFLRLSANHWFYLRRVLPLRVRTTTSGTPSFHRLTGTCDSLAFPPYMQISRIRRALMHLRLKSTLSTRFLPS